MEKYIWSSWPHGAAEGLVACLFDDVMDGDSSGHYTARLWGRSEAQRVNGKSINDRSRIQYKDRYLLSPSRDKKKTPVTRHLAFNELISELNSSVWCLCFASAQRSAWVWQWYIKLEFSARALTADLITEESVRTTAESRRWWMIKRSRKN